MTRIVPVLTDEQRIGLIDASRTFLGTPYRHRGRNASGMDCAGAVVAGLASMGIAVRDRDAYSPQPDGSTLRAEMVAHFGCPVWRKGDPLEGLRPCDVVLLKWHRHPCHVALVTDYMGGGLALLHSWSDAGRVVEHRLGDPWVRRLVEGWRL